MCIFKREIWLFIFYLFINQLICLFAGGGGGGGSCSFHFNF